jgi:hypothetical protein
LTTNDSSSLIANCRVSAIFADDLAKAWRELELSPRATATAATSVPAIPTTASRVATMVHVRCRVGPASRAELPMGLLKTLPITAATSPFGLLVALSALLGSRLRAPAIVIIDERDPDSRDPAGAACWLSYQLKGESLPAGSR